MPVWCYRPVAEMTALTLQCSHRFFIELCTFIPLVCCAFKAATPPTTADCGLVVAGVLKASLGASCLRGDEQESTLCDRLRTVCCVGRQGGILGAAWAMDRARSAERSDEAVRSLMVSNRKAISAPGMLGSESKRALPGWDVVWRLDSAARSVRIKVELHFQCVAAKSKTGGYGLCATITCTAHCHLQVSSLP